MSNRIFVFGSNLAGRHGAGSAKEARLKHGAEYGIGVGRTGNSYAIPTKGHCMEVLGIPFIKKRVDEFLEYAALHSNLEFDVVKIGCGLAGYSESQMSVLFSDHTNNVHLPPGWRKL